MEVTIQTLTHYEEIRDHLAEIELSVSILVVFLRVYRDPDQQSSTLKTKGQVQVSIKDVDNFIGWLEAPHLYELNRDGTYATAII